MSFDLLTTANTVPQMMTTINAIAAMAGLWDAAPEVVASAATTNIAAHGGLRTTISGNTTITSFGSAANRVVMVDFLAALTLTHNATSLILPGGANIVTAAGDTAIFASSASGNWSCLAFTRANGKAVSTSVTSGDIAASVLSSLAFGPFTALASASTTDLSSAGTIATSITGTSTITSFGTGANLLRIVRFTATLTLTHNATSLILPGGANIVTAAGDTAILVSDASGNWTCVSYLRATGKAVVANSFSDLTDIASGLAVAPFGSFTALASASTTNLASVATVGVNITGTSTITSFGTGANLLRIGKFAAALTLTHNATSLILPGGANIVTAAGDTFLAMSDASGNWSVINYTRANGQAVSLSSGQVQTALGYTAASAARQVVGGGLATGGGDLSNDRTITVTASSISEAKAGTNTTTVMTPAATAAAMAGCLIRTITASDTLVLNDAGKTLETNVASANNLTVPPNSSVNFEVGDVINLVQYGVGQTTIVAGAGVTIRSVDSKMKLAKRYSGASLYKRDTNEWVLMGDLA